LKDEINRGERERESEREREGGGREREKDREREREREKDREREKTGREGDIRRFIFHTDHARREYPVRERHGTADNAHSPGCLLAILLKQF